MTPKAHAIEISAICGFFILLALGGVAWDISSGLLTSGIDGIMLLFVCAMMAGIFFLIMLAQLIKSGIIPTPKFLQAAAKPAGLAAPAAGGAAKPVAPAATSSATPAATPAKSVATSPATAGATPPPKLVTPSATPANTPGNGPSAAPAATPSAPTRAPEK